MAAGGTASPGDENSPENGSLAPMGLAPSSDWSSLIIAIDYVLALDNEEWSRRLAVLTREALYLLQPEVGEPDPLMLFGRAWWRISMQDIVDIQLVPAEKQLRICTSLIFERDAHLREAPGCADMRRWHGVIGTVWSERSEPVLKTALESCLPGAAENRPSSPSFGLSWSKQSRPWRRDALPEILALGTLLKERDGLLWGGWTERTFVLTASGKLLYYLRTESNDEAPSPTLAGAPLPPSLRPPWHLVADGTPPRLRRCWATCGASSIWTARSSSCAPSTRRRSPRYAVALVPP